MRHSTPSVRLTLATLALCACAQVQAQGQPPEVVSCERTRAEVRNECVAFLRAYRWDESKGDYVPRFANKGKAGAQPPEGVKSRAEVRAERDNFMKANRWNDIKGQWEPIAGAPRDVSTMSRAEVRKETQAFMRSHRWDESTQTYVDKPAKSK